MLSYPGFFFLSIFDGGGNSKFLVPDGDKVNGGRGDLRKISD